MNLIDFIIGGLLMNAMPHFIFGITNVKYLGMFGFSTTGNIVYSLLQFGVCLILFHLQYDITHLFENGMFMGGLTVLISFYLFGRILFKLFNRKK